MSSSRRERREYAKKLGILSKKETYEQMMERFRRSNTAGGYLHTHHLQELKNQQLEREQTSNPDTTEDAISQEDQGINPFVFLGKK